MKQKGLFFIFSLIIACASIFAQTGNVRGTVVDANNNPIVGANVIVQGTTLGAASDTDGNYEIKSISVGNVNIIASAVGYRRVVQPVEIFENRTVEISFSLQEVALKISDVVVEGNIAKARETPVAFTDVSEEHIKRNFTIQDIPHLFANTPGVYVTSDGGSGMGDSQVMIRGFDEQRIQVMINNVPVNDPESKKVYWSNWGSLPAASQSVQIQRGVGSSLYGSGALGGSINVVTKDAPAAASLAINSTVGQFGIFKSGFDYNSGLINDKFAFIARMNYTTGNGWRRDTYYEGLNYYFSAMYFPNDKNTIKVIFHGAPQYHAYSYYGFPAADFAKYGRDFNGHPYVTEGEISGSFYDGRETSLMDVLAMKTDIGNSSQGGVVIGNDIASFDNNVYHKPQFEIHHNYQVSPDTKWTTTFFASKGYGYGENINSYYKIARDANGLNTLAGIYDVNSSSFYQYRAYSDHFQAGLSTHLATKWNNHDISAGVEFRYWNARHAGEIINTFSRDKISYYIGNVKQEFSNGDLYYDNTTTKPQVTGYIHALWKFGDLSVMTDLSATTVNYQITEDMPSSNNYPTDTRAHGGGTWSGSGTSGGETVVYELWDYDKTFNWISPKVGVNYNVTDELNVFANFSMAVNEPRVKYFFNYGSPNDDLDLEETKDLELGLAFRNNKIDVQYNFYNIDFSGKALNILDPTKANTPGYDYKGRKYIPIGDSRYQGHEAAITFLLTKELTVGLNASLSSNEWGEPGDSEGAQFLYANDKVVAGVDYTDADGDGKWDAGELALHKDFTEKFGKKVEVGMPQAIFGMTFNYTTDNYFISGALRSYRDIYILEDNSETTVEGHLEGDEWISDKESPKLPAATVVDLVAGLNLNFVKVPVALSFHVNNVFNTEYWQKGDKYGFLPGAERTFVMNASITLF